METTTPSSRTIDPTKLPSDPSLRDEGAFVDLYLNDKEFREYASKVYSYLDTMKPGHILRLDKYTDKQREWIVRTGCFFISTGLHWVDYEFSDDYMAIRRRQVSQQTFDFIIKAKAEKA